MVVDIRFQQLLAEKAQSTFIISVPQAMPMYMPSTQTSMAILLPNPTPIPPNVSIKIPQSQAALPYPLLFPRPQVAEPLMLANSHVRHPSADSTSVRFVLVTSPCLFSSDFNPDHFSVLFGHKSSLDATPS
jgi:hypothetical protein